MTTNWRNTFYPYFQAVNFVSLLFGQPLTYHELTTFNPSKVTVAVPNNTEHFEISTTPTEVYFFREKVYQAGIATKRTSYGSFKVYNKVKTVCDMFRFRNALGEDLARPEANLNELQQNMKTCRVNTVMGPYLKALVTI